MPYFKDLNNSLHFLEDAKDSYILPAGCTPISDADAEVIKNPPFTAQQITAALTTAVQEHLDTVARARNYDGILSLCSYATSSDPKFGAEGRAGVVWRDAVWSTCYSVMAEVQAGIRPTPTVTDLLALLPSIVW